MQITPETDRAVADIAARHGVSRETALALLAAVQAGGGTMAQFAIPELGGSGQWMRGGMTMVGSMFDNALKARVDALCTELAALVATLPPAPVAPAAAAWWPAELGTPSSAGGQNDTRYAVFPAQRRLAIQTGGVTRVFDTGEHRIGGVQQQQGGGPAGVSFTSQLGTFDVSSLREVGGGRHAAPEPAPPSPGAPDDGTDIIAAIESLAGLHQRGILTDEEFATKKAELLGRL
jgi:hypothetical protein